MLPAVLFLYKKTLYFVFPLKTIKKGTASSEDIAVGSVEASEIPGVGNTVVFPGKGQEKPKLVFRVATQNPFCVSYICIIHTEKVVIAFIIRFCELDCPFSLAGNTVLCQLFPGRGIDRVACSAPDFFPACSAGADNKLVGQSFFLHHILQDKFCHGAPAYIAVADEHNSYHIKFLSQIAVK